MFVNFYHLNNILLLLDLRQLDCRNLSRSEYKTPLFENFTSSPADGSGALLSVLIPTCAFITPIIMHVTKRNTNLFMVFSFHYSLVCFFLNNHFIKPTNHSTPKSNYPRVLIMSAFNLFLKISPPFNEPLIERPA